MFCSLANVRCILLICRDLIKVGVSVHLGSVEAVFMSQQMLSRIIWPCLLQARGVRLENSTLIKGIPFVDQMRSTQSCVDAPDHHWRCRHYSEFRCEHRRGRIYQHHWVVKVTVSCCTLRVRRIILPVSCPTQSSHPMCGLNATNAWIDMMEEAWRVHFVHLFSHAWEFRKNSTSMLPHCI